MKKNSFQLVLLGSLFIISNPIFCEEALLTYFSTGLLYSKGNADLGDLDSKTYSVPLMLSGSYQRFNGSLATSYVHRNSDEAGLGDTTLSLGYDLSENPGFTVMLKEKFATGDKDEGLSTGGNDTSLQLDYFTPLNDRISLMGSLGYTFVGKPDRPIRSTNHPFSQELPLQEKKQTESSNSTNTQAGTDLETGTNNHSDSQQGTGNQSNLQDSTYASIGTTYLLSDKTNIGLLIDYQQSIHKQLDEQTGLSFFMNQSLSSDWSISALFAYDNLHTSSLGITLTTRF